MYESLAYEQELRPICDPDRFIKLLVMTVETYRNERTGIWKASRGRNREPYETLGDSGAKTRVRENKIGMKTKHSK